VDLTCGEASDGRWRYVISIADVATADVSRCGARASTWKSHPASASAFSVQQKELIMSHRTLAACTLALSIFAAGIAEADDLNKARTLINAAAGGPVIAAAPPCYGSSCTNLNPSSTGCSNSANGPVYTLQNAQIYYNGTLVGAVELRYSQWCNARWARTYSYIGNRCIGAQMLTSSGSPVSSLTNTYLCYQSDVFSNMYGGAAGKAKGYLYVTENTASYRSAVTNAQ
jgi:Protein of unknown function (DUF2690)